MPKSYHHLTRDTRCQLCALTDSGKSIRNIAVMLGVHRSTLYRELDRNKGPKGYRYEQAQKRAFESKKIPAKNRLKMIGELTGIIEARLRLQWSPEQISGWLKR